MDQPKPLISLIKQTFDQLLTGLDYGAYRKQRSARMDDQLIRSRASLYLSQAREITMSYWDAWKTKNIPRSMTRDTPLPSREILDHNAAIDTAVQDLTALSAQLMAMPVPESSDFWDRYASQEERADKLRQQDQLILPACYEMKRLASELDLSQSLTDAQNAAFIEQFPTIRALLRERTTLLNS